MKHTLFIIKTSGIQSYSIKADDLELKVLVSDAQFTPQLYRLALCEVGENWSKKTISNDYPNLPENNILEALDIVGRCEGWQKVYFDGIQIWNIQRLIDQDTAEKLTKFLKDSYKNH